MTEPRLVSPAERLSRPEVEELQLGRLRTQLARAFHSIPFYRSRWEAAGVTADSLDKITDLATFRELIPTCAKSDFVKDQDENPPWGTRLGVEPTDLDMMVFTSGSSGMGRELYGYTHADWEQFATCCSTTNVWSGATPGGIVAGNVPGGFTLAGYGGDFIANALGMTKLQLGMVTDTDAKVDYLQTFGPAVKVLFTPTPTMLTRFTTVLQQRGLAPADVLPNLQVVYATGEAYPLEWMETMLDIWPGRIMEPYGSSSLVFCVNCELGPVHDGKRGVLHNFEQYTLVEVLGENGQPVAPGERGEVHLTNLTKQASPVINYATGDLATFMPYDLCACGRPFNGLEAGTIGRKDDMVKVRSMNLWPSAVDDVVFGAQCVDYVADITIDDQGRERITLSVAPPSDHPDASGLATELEAVLKKKTGIRIDVRTISPEELPTYEYKARRWHDRRSEHMASFGQPRSDA